jgi:hypothetical protein
MSQGTFKTTAAHENTKQKTLQMMDFSNILRENRSNTLVSEKWHADITPSPTTFRLSSSLGNAKKYR